MCAAYRSNARRKVSDGYDNREGQDINEESGSPANYLDIWYSNPSYKDIQAKPTSIKLLSLNVILVFLFALSYMLFSNLYLSLLMTSLILIFSIVAFKDNFFIFQNTTSSVFNKINQFDPFKNIQFWVLEDDPATFLITNKKDLLTVATRIFEIKILPESVQPTLNHFLKSLNTTEILYTYQVVHKPIIRLPVKSVQKNYSDDLKNTPGNNILGSFKISIYFSVYQIAKGILTSYKLMKLIETVKKYSTELKSLFSANFHHTKISLLTDKSLTNAFRTLFTKEEIDFVQNDENYSKPRESKHQFLLKSSFIALITVYVSLSLFFLNVSWEWIVIVDLTLIISVIFLWWKDLFFFFTNSYLNRRNQINLVDPFSNVQFYRLKGINDTLFLYINRELLIGLKSYNLREAFYSYSSYSSKFFRILNEKNVPFIYTLHTSATTPALFRKECDKFLNEKARIELRRIYGDTVFGSVNESYSELQQEFPGVKYPKIEFKKWLQMRTGIWQTTLTISCFSYKFTSFLRIEDFVEIEEELSTNSHALSKAYEGNFINHKLVPLKNNLLVSGFLTECLKNNRYRSNGTHLNYLYFQGKTLIELLRIVNEFKKGIETMIAAEFNTPLYLENYITIGNTVNTEFLEEEVPLGLKFDQINQLLITNGTSGDRELACMKIVSKLIKKEIPSIIFDFSGNWTKIIKYFEDSRYQKEFLYFKLGGSFNVNLLHSEIKYDKNNPLYLNYFYDAYAMAYKEQKRNVDALKEIVLKNQERTLSSVTFDLQMMQKWEKGPSYDDILSFFNDFVQQSVIFSDKLYEYEGKITPTEFLKDDKTIILDLSVLTDLEQKVFVTFVLISKIIHYINNSSEYIEKKLIIPHADVFFDSYYLDNNYANKQNYGKVDKFLDPLIQKGFGVILCSNQIRYLHPNVFNYVDNIIAFKAKDKRDLAVLKNQMNLQELHGTGYYSSRRNNTYQIEYLMNMKHDEVLIKRSDIYQPFPGIIKLKKLTDIPEMNYYEIVGYMKSQGYNLKLAEEKILKKAKKTFFEKDLGIYYEFKDEIKDFLAGIKKVDKVALNGREVKKVLTKFIHSKSSEKTNNKKHIKEIRDEIFKILVTQGYLETLTRKTAGGSEAMYACYIVGQKYEDALNDDFESKKDYKEILVEPIEINSKGNNSPYNFSQTEPYDKELIRGRIREILSDLCSKLFSNLFQMYKYLNRRNYDGVLRFGSHVIINILKNFYHSFNQQLKEFSARFEKLEILHDYLYENDFFPFNISEILNYLKQTKMICNSKSEANNNSKAVELYQLIEDFYHRIMIFLKKM